MDQKEASELTQMATGCHRNFRPLRDEPSAKPNFD